MHGSFIGYDAESGTAVAVTINTRNPESQAIMAIETLAAGSQAG